MYTWSLRASTQSPRPALATPFSSCAASHSTECLDPILSKRSPNGNEFTYPNIATVPDHIPNTAAVSCTSDTYFSCHGMHAALQICLLQVRSDVPRLGKPTWAPKVYVSQEDGGHAFTYFEVQVEARLWPNTS